MQTNSPWRPLVELLFTEIKLFPKKRAEQPAPLTVKPVKTGFALDGVLSPGEMTTYSVNGEDFAIDSDTWIVGVLRPGTIVQVKGVFGRQSEKIATSIKTLSAC